VAEIHPRARGFDHAADAYERARPGYPPAAVALIVERAGIVEGTRVLDLAAGTGKLSRPLAAAGARIVAVDPSAPMLERLRATLPDAETHVATAEQLPLPDASVDAAVVGQAFHWFVPERALPEIHRVLRPRGVLALIWNTRDQTDPLQRELSKVFAPLERDTPRHRGTGSADELARSSLFAELEAHEFSLRQELDEDGLVDRVLSVSFVAEAGEAAGTRVEAQVRDLARRLPRPIVLRYTTQLFLARRRP
jgi:ubiquinone/menaquinone biosynthesis C-methylase UbiE